MVSLGVIPRQLGMAAEYGGNRNINRSNRLSNHGLAISDLSNPSFSRNLAAKNRRFTSFNDLPGRDTLVQAISSIQPSPY